MSLLMDALRRAEADKKAQAERTARAAGGDAGSAAGPLTRVSSYNNAKDDTVQIDGRALQAAAASMADLDLPIADGFEPALTTSHAEPLSLEAVDTSPQASTDSARDARARRGGADGDGYGGNVTFAGHIDRRAQSGTAARDSEDELDDYFDPPYPTPLAHDTARSDDGTLDQVAAHTVANAQTVFSASERPRAGRVLTLAAALTVCALLGIAALGVYYAARTPPQRPMPSPAVARGVEKTPVLAALPVAPATGESPLPPIDASGLPLATSIPPAAQGASELASASAATSNTDVAPAPPLPTPRRAAIRPARPALSVPLRVVSEEINSGEVQISRSLPAATVDANLALAYGAFQRRDLDTAAQLYGAAHRADPGRRDTLLGLAAVALGRGDLTHAYEGYMEVLTRYPQDPVASAALFSMTEAEGEAGAARLRLLLDAHGDASYIHAALGTWYARRGRWADAQQAYFDALRLDAANPDYSFNLAVSLEHLGQGPAALAHYQQSLALRAHHGAGFDVHLAEDRIRALSAPAAQ